jgi:hypothetical protein
MVDGVDGCVVCGNAFNEHNTGVEDKVVDVDGLWLMLVADYDDCRPSLHHQPRPGTQERLIHSQPRPVSLYGWRLYFCISASSHLSSFSALLEIRRPATMACCPRRCFLVDINTLLSSNSNKDKDKSNSNTKGITLLRLMGTVVSIVLNEPPSILLDDGTGLASIVTPLAMLEAIHCCIGSSLDCIARVDYSYDSCDSNSNTNTDTNTDTNTNSNFRLHADSLIVVQDAHAETLRWLELTYLKKNPHHQQRQSQSQPKTLYLQSRTGYPCGSVQPDDVYQLIQSDGNDDCVYQGQKGVSAKDLALLLDISVEHVQDMIQELQIDGLVYQNQEGGYMPL